MSSLGPICAFISSVTWAIGAGQFSRLSLSYSPFTINFTRATIALPLFLLTVIITAGGLGPAADALSALRPEHWGWFTLSMFSSYGFGDALFLWSTQSLGVPGALAIASCYPLWTALAGFVIDGQALSLSQIAGLLITLGGVTTVILSEPKKGVNLADPEHPRATGMASGNRGRGVLLATLTSIFWACNGFALSHGGRGVPAAVCNTARMMIALVISLAMGRWLARRSPVIVPARELKRRGWVFALEGFGGSYFFMYGLANSPLAMGTTLTSLAPVISVPVSVALGLERFSIRRTLGILAVVLGLYLLV